MIYLPSAWKTDSDTTPKRKQEEPTLRGSSHELRLSCRISTKTARRKLRPFLFGHAEKSLVVVSGRPRKPKSIHTAGWKIRATSYLTPRPLPTARSLEFEPPAKGESETLQSQEEREKDREARTQSVEAHMAEKQDPPEYVTIYRTAQEMLQSAKSWHPDARLMGNVRAGDLAAVRDVLQQLIWESGRDSS